MEKVAKFETVSLDQFIKDCDSAYKDNNHNLSYYSSSGCIFRSEDQVFRQLMLPKRATKGSAGYDFFTPFSIVIEPGDFIKLPTGIRCKIDDGYVLQLYPRSGLGSKKGLQIRNTVGIIDSDYYNAENEGHIMAVLVNTGGHSIYLESGDAFMQGVFVPYAITYDDEAVGERIGGFGSTSK